MLPVNNETIRYRGSPGGLDADLLLKVLGELRPVKPVLPWIPSGGVSRDKEKAAAWAKWYSDYQHERFRRDPIDNCRLTLLLLAQEKAPSLNLVFRYEPMRGQGSIGFRSFIWRVAEEEYACFEY